MNNTVYYDVLGPAQWSKFKEENGFEPGCMYPDCNELVTKIWFRAVEETSEEDNFEYSYETIAATCDNPVHVPAYNSPMIG